MIADREKQKVTGLKRGIEVSMSGGKEIQRHGSKEKKDGNFPCPRGCADCRNAQLRNLFALVGDGNLPAGIVPLKDQEEALFAGPRMKRKKRWPKGRDLKAETFHWTMCKKIHLNKT